jgi:hypothetical protein
MGSWLIDSAGNPNSLAKRIATAHDLYGRPEWIETGNWGDPQATSTLINFFHSHGIKVSCRIWSKYGAVPLNTILHDMNVANGYGGSVDYQMSIGPEIDMIMIDETSQDASFVSYYAAIRDYVHSLGKLVAMNTGGPMHDSTIPLADILSYEFWWYGAFGNTQQQSYLTAYPNKFIGVSNDWGYQHPTETNVQTPTTADPATGRSEYTSPLSEARALWETLYAWEHGIYHIDVRPGQDEILPDWWEDYLSQLPL